MTKVIKAIQCKTFTVELRHIPITGEYIVGYEDTEDILEPKAKYLAPVTSVELALNLFEAKLRQLKGH